jgi:hypothetical protein
MLRKFQRHTYGTLLYFRLLILLSWGIGSRPGLAKHHGSGLSSLAGPRSDQLPGILRLRPPATNRLQTNSNVPLGLMYTEGNGT